MGNVLAATNEIAQEVGKTVEENLRLFSPGFFLEYLKDSSDDILDFLIKLVLAIIFLLIGRKVIKVVRKLVRRFLDGRSWDMGVKQFFDNLLYVFLHFVLIMMVLGKFGITASSVIAVIGSVGLSVGLALQGSLANFAGGVLILLLHPFRVGDYIKEDNNGNEGTVVEIQLFYTKLLTYDNRTIILPNGPLSNCSLTNLTNQDKRRVDITVGISYQADIKKAREVLNQVIEQEEKCLPNEPHNVCVDALGESSVDMKVFVWVRTEDYFEVKWRMTENIKYALDENGIEIPFPQITVHQA